MKYKKITFLILLSSFLLPMYNVYGQPNFIYNDIHELDDGETLFYLVDLNITENIQVVLNRLNYGNYSIFLFDSRPINTYIKSDNQLDSRIYSIDSYINHSIGINPYINHTATETKIYYIQIILLNNGSDTFILESTKQLSRYYIPLIPGFPLETTIGFTLIALIFVSLIYKKKNKKIKI
ncbi:MAG: hypothetical protein KGD57_02180 [Candidatus Lokiarchaeota archaeon]|nr:hypothetical protein [Candidatus Lokiarchaeota archaeon]